MSEDNAKIRFCPHCGARDIPDSSAYCYSCGEGLPIIPGRVEDGVPPAAPRGDKNPVMAGEDVVAPEPAFTNTLLQEEGAEPAAGRRGTSQASIGKSKGLDAAGEHSDLNVPTPMDPQPECTWRNESVASGDIRPDNPVVVGMPPHEEFSPELLARLGAKPGGQLVQSSSGAEAASDSSASTTAVAAITEKDPVYVPMPREQAFPIADRPCDEMEGSHSPQREPVTAMRPAVVRNPAVPHDIENDAVPAEADSDQPCGRTGVSEDATEDDPGTAFVPAMTALADEPEDKRRWRLIVITAIVAAAIGIAAGMFIQHNISANEHSSAMSEMESRISELQTQVSEYKEKADEADRLRERIQNLFSFEYNDEGTSDTEEHEGEEAVEAHGGAVLGVLGMTSTEPAGAEIVQVMGDSAASEAGLISGQVITSVGGSVVKTQEDLKKLVSSHEPGDSVEVGLSDGTYVNITLR